MDSSVIHNEANGLVVRPPVLACSCMSHRPLGRFLECAYRSDLRPGCLSDRFAWETDRSSYGSMVIQDVHITAWGSFALEVVNRNFRSFSVVSGEKVNNLDSEY